MPKVSVVIPAYNAEKYIADAVCSVTAQTERDIEILIVDDCSTDTTADICRTLAASDDRIRIITNEKNSGVSFSRNVGVAAAVGDYVAFLDSDDKWREDKLAFQLKETATHPECAIFFTASSFTDEDGVPFNYIFNVPETVDFKALLRQNVISCSSVMLPRDVILAHSFKNDRMHEDYAVWLEILKDGTTARGIPEPLLIYRLVGGSKSSNKLHAALMQYRVYRHVGLSVLQALYYMPIYTVNGIKKHSGIKNSGCGNKERADK